MAKNIQVCATIEAELLEQIKVIAAKDNRSSSQMISILLKAAVKERNRKKGAKDNI